MFEESPPSPAAREADSVAGGALRVPGWPDIVARLAAAHDLRAALAKGSARDRGSFAGFAAEREQKEVNESAARVNPTGLAHGKTGRGIADPAVPDAVDADRETQ